jgi:hypothetical protein
MGSVLSRNKKFGTKQLSRRGTIRRHAQAGVKSKPKPPNRAAVAAFNLSRRSRIIVEEWDKSKRPAVAVKTRTIFKHPAQ